LLDERKVKINGRRAIIAENKKWGNYQVEPSFRQTKNFKKELEKRRTTALLVGTFQKEGASCLRELLIEGEGGERSSHNDRNVVLPLGVGKKNLEEK